MIECPGTKHKYGEDEDMICDGMPHISLDHDTVCEYRARCMELYGTYNVIPGNPALSKESLQAAIDLGNKQSTIRGTYARAIDYVDMDGQAIQMIPHPKPKFNLFKWIKSIFVRPKFSAASLEPAEKITIHTTKGCPLCNPNTTFIETK